MVGDGLYQDQRERNGSKNKKRKKKQAKTTVESWIPHLEGLDDSP